MNEIPKCCRMRNISWFLTLLVILINLCNINAADSKYIHKDGYCMMYDECAINTLNKAKIGCLYNKKAPLLTDPNGLELLKEICPYLYKGDNSTQVCCSTSQLQTLADNLRVPLQYLNRCPNCYSNFVAMYCEMTCSSNQSSFVDVETTGTKDDSILHIHPIKNGTYVSRLNYTINNEYAYTMFNSCQHVSSPSTNSPAIKLLCGPYADGCTAHKWITYMNSLSNGLAPFQIDVTFVDDPKIGMNYNTTACNETMPGSIGHCSCNDCPAACSGPPPTPPIPPTPWLIFGIDGFYIIMPVVYTIFCIVFVNIVVCFHISHKNGNRASDSCCTVVDDNTVSARDDDLGVRSVDGTISKYLDDEKNIDCIQKFGLFLENGLKKVFRIWGTFCASHPISVLVCGVVVIGVCSAGLKFMTITTDPVELWSAPTSTARLNKDYYDQHFGPFYRTEQLIITVPKINSSIYSPYTDFPADKEYIPFGPILDYDILKEILKLQSQVEKITAEENGETVTLNDICLKPLAPYNNNCTIMSVLNYFQNDIENLEKSVWSEGKFYLYADFHDHLIACTNGAAAIDDATKLHLSCLGTFGGPVFPWVALGGYDATNYLNATAAVITIPVVNYYNNTAAINKALAWEKEFVSFMKNFSANNPKSNLSVVFSSERSIEDEINRESSADVMTILASYLIMFAYVAISLGKFGNCNFGRMIVDAQLTVGLSGVLIVLCSVAMSLGIFSYAGVPLTLIIVEVVPFLALAVGVDNIFILVQHVQRDEKRNKESVEEQLGRVLAEVAPSMFMSSLSETIAFFLGGLSTMPAVRTFSMFAGLAVFCDFLLQMTCFVAILALDSKRRTGNRYDCLCCVKNSNENDSENEGILYLFMKNYFSPAVLSKYVRPIGILIFAGMGCFSGAVLHKVEIGLDQSLSMPSDSYVLNYFDGINKYLSVGAPVYFVVPEGHDYLSQNGANEICGGTGCNNDSLITYVSHMSKMPNYSHIAYPASSWLDDYFDWLNPQTKCCRFNDTGNSIEFCNATVVSDTCESCRSASEVNQQVRPTPDEFMEFLPWFLQDNPELKCAKGGHAAYGSSVNIIGKGNDSRVGATQYMAYHTVARVSSDFIGCLEQANAIAANISKSMNQTVFPYSIFYVFYEQYLTIVDDTIFNLGISIAAIFVIVFLLLGWDLVSALLVVFTIVLILLDMFGIMFLWNIPLNAVSLVNLVMAVGISVEFCAHIARAFAMSQRLTRVGRAEEALAEMGSSVLSGITLTKLVGIFILAFSKSKIFQIFYFRMYFGVVVLGFSHGLIFLPILLSYIGPKRRHSSFKYSQFMNESCDINPAPNSFARVMGDDVHVSTDSNQKLINSA